MKLRSAILRAVSSNAFFVGVIVVLVLQALWIALSSRYPMAFDEDFHLGLIKLYSHHVNPFLSQQPPDADAYGAVFRDPSYLYHYLMSFPYRLISAFTHDQTIQVLVLRGVNIALFAACLPLYRKLARMAGISRITSNLVMACVVLVPVVPLLAAQINYDNLLLPLTGLALLLTARFAVELKTHDRVNARILCELLIVCLLASLVQYEFLPIFLAIVIYASVLLNKRIRNYAKAWSAFQRSYYLITRGARLALIVVVLLSGMLFFQRYGVNAISYKNPIPDCGKVLSVQKCSAYGPWNRNYIDAQNKAGATRNPLVFVGDWFDGMWLRSFFAVAGPDQDFETRGPLPVPGIAAIVMAGIGLVLFIVYAKRIFRRYNHTMLWLFVSATVIYLGALWLDEYHDFLATGQPVAINGRYLLPVLLPILVCLAMGYAEALRNRPRLKTLTVGAGVFCLLWGGGALTYILRSNNSWLWPNQAVVDANNAVRKTLDPITPGINDPAEFL